MADTRPSPAANPNPNPNPGRQNNGGGRRNRGGGGGGNGGGNGNGRGRPQNNPDHRRGGHGGGGGGGGGGSGGRNAPHPARRSGGHGGGRGRKVHPQVHVEDRKDHAGVPIQFERQECHICCQPSDIFGFGKCQHAVCLECCIKIRVLCESQQCPQCRAPIEELYIASLPFSLTPQGIPTTDVPVIRSKKYGIHFANDYCVKCYDAYLCHECKFCKAEGIEMIFNTFNELRLHTSQTHGYLYCTICTENLSLLTKDRTTYKREDLEKHITGKLTETNGEQGHPTCLFCPDRFFNNEHRYRHLRTQHFFCQVCESNGRVNQFFETVEQLHRHYRKSHHPCMVQECREMGIVFGDDVDLQVHMAAEHTGNANNRHINIDFRINHRSGFQDSRGSSNNHQNPSPPSQPPQESLPNVTVRIVPSAQHTMTRIVPGANFRPSAGSTEDFPTLGGAAPPPPPAAVSAAQYSMPNWRREAQAMQAQNPPVNLNNTREQFPALRPKPRPPVAPAEEFPTLGAPTKKAAPGSVWGKGKPPSALFSNNSQPDQNASAKPSGSKRPKVLPIPDIWPEHMQDRVRAVQNGQPDPGPSQSEPQDPLLYVEANKKAKKVAQRSKAVPISAVMARMQETPTLGQKSKFEILAELEEKERLKNERKAKKQQDKAGGGAGAAPAPEPTAAAAASEAPTSSGVSYTRTEDNFVRIEPVSTLRAVAAKLGPLPAKKTAAEVAASVPAHSPSKAVPATTKPPPPAPAATADPWPSLFAAPFSPNLSTSTPVAGESSTNAGTSLAERLSSLWPFSSGSTTTQNPAPSVPPGFSVQPPPGFC